MNNKWNKITWSVILYGILALLLNLIDQSYPNSDFSLGGWLFIIIWLSIAVLGITALILRRIGIIQNTQFIYIFLGAANLCNAVWGAIILWTHRGHDNMTIPALQFGATLCIAFLILTDIFF